MLLASCTRDSVSRFRLTPSTVAPGPTTGGAPFRQQLSRIAFQRAKGKSQDASARALQKPFLKRCFYKAPLSFAALPPHTSSITTRTSKPEFDSRNLINISTRIAKGQTKLHRIRINNLLFLMKVDPGPRFAIIGAQTALLGAGMCERKL